MAWKPALPLSFWFDGGRRLVKSSREPGEVPAAGELRLGEIATNSADGAVFLAKLDGQVDRLPVAEGVRRVEVVTQAAYDALVAAGTVESTTLYVVTG